MLFEAHPEIDIHEMSPLALAFAGDAVLELLVRQRLVETSRLQPGRLHSVATHYVSAHAQNQELALIEPMLTEEEQNNTPPVPVNPVIEETVKIWPFVGGSFTLDMNTLATDAQDSTLRYKIESTSFIEGMDYTVDNNGILTMDHFSLSKGSFTISATDSGGLSCEINVIVKSINIGLMTLIGMGVLALVTAVIFVILLYIALTKPFRGTISAQSYCCLLYTSPSPRDA